MIQLSRKFFYAAEALLYIAYNAGSDPVNSREIAIRQGMKPRHLEQMMQRLARAGVLRGVRGPHGGYLLAREKRRITLSEIFKALAEDEDLPSSTPLGNQIIAPLMRKWQNDILEQLKDITLADLYDQATERRIRKMTSTRHDFTI